MTIQRNGCLEKKTISSGPLSSHLFLTFLHASIAGETKMQGKELRVTWMQLRELGLCMCQTTYGELIADKIL